MAHRTVKIDGEPKKISRAVAMIYGVLEERADDFKDIGETDKPFTLSDLKTKESKEVFDLHHTKCKASFVIDNKVVGFIIGRNGQFTKYWLEKYDVIFKIVDQRRFQKVIRRYEDVAILSGKLKDVQKWSDLLIEKVHDYYNNSSRSSYVSSSSAAKNTKLLIPGYLVTKIIGARGCMIREIAARSGGTQIKILSDKSAERDLPEIVVWISGSLKGKQEAAAIILEQIEVFKNGGPVLTTGSCLNDNIANQYKNSVQGQGSLGRKSERRRSRRKYSSSDSSRRRRSRSSSLEERYTKRNESENYSKRNESESYKNAETPQYQQREEHEIAIVHNSSNMTAQEVSKAFMNNTERTLLASNLQNKPEESKSIKQNYPGSKQDIIPTLPNIKASYEEEVRMKSILNLEMHK